MNVPSFSQRRGKRRPTMPNSDLGLRGNPGKGDAPRNCFSTEFRNNYDRIDWCRQPGWSTAGGFKKVYHANHTY